MAEGDEGVETKVYKGKAYDNDGFAGAAGCHGLFGNGAAFLTRKIYQTFWGDRANGRQAVTTGLKSLER